MNFFARLAPLASRIGQYWLQLPATFGPRDLPALWHFSTGCRRISPTASRFVTPNSSPKAKRNSQLNRGLHERNVNRVILDSRPVHRAAATSPAMIDAQKKKPKVPVHAVMTARQPMVRFIGGDDMAHNRELFRVWLQTLPKWHQSGTPWLFLHTPDIAYAPTLVDTLWSDLRTALPAAGNAPSIPQQSSLF
ncbi:DUF72 domain-containing protein [Klebsiella variicola subsp. variicola]|nr:DUF72 domain-containing protein [Klebsiella variicola subsp. variicola]